MQMWPLQNTKVQSPFPHNTTEWSQGWLLCRLLLCQSFSHKTFWSPLSTSKLWPNNNKNVKRLNSVPPRVSLDGDYSINYHRLGKRNWERGGLKKMVYDLCNYQISIFFISIPPMAACSQCFSILTLPKHNQLSLPGLIHD
jgi:hypothetical protein